MLDDLKSLPKPVEGIELIQQWQYLGKVHPKLLEDKAFENCKKAGLTSVQSYVYWAEIEKERGKVDFSSYDVLVEKLAKHELKWVPFLILGPYYATPKWFQESEESVYAKCLEHGKESKIQSIWNPFLPKWVDRFLKLVAEHYYDCDVLECITLGISGNWGESIYPASGGFYGGFHTHPGWWCGDKYAISSFRKFTMEKYESLQKLNATWGTNFGDLEEISFPSLRYRRGDYLHQVFNIIPNWAKPGLASLWKLLRFILNKGTTGFTSQIRLSSKEDKAKITERQRWLDFVYWYLSSMTEWAEFWVRTARKYFPDTEIYLVTGGIGEPKLGADFSAQTKMVSKYNAGIRITNQTDDYGESFIHTRLVSSVYRFYKTYFTTEEGGINSPPGITMRVFDVATSGAKGAYFKSIIGTGTDLCTGRTFTLGEPTKGAVNLAKNIHHITLSEPLIEVAVLFPNTSIALDPAILSSVYNQCSQLRDVVDLDLVDENMIADNVLKKYRFFVLLDANWLRQQTLINIENWVREGGILIGANYLKFLSIERGVQLYQQLFPQHSGMIKLGDGYTLLFNGKRRAYLEFIKHAVYNQQKKYPWIGIPEIDDEWDGVYATLFAHRIIYYNSNDHTIKKRVKIKNFPEKVNFEVNIAPHSIVFVSID